MKLFPIFAILAVGCFATIGFVAGTLVAGDDSGVPGASDRAVPAMPGTAIEAPSQHKPELPADVILRAAEAGKGTATEKPPASGPVATPHLVKMANVTLPVRKRQSVSFVVADLAVAVTDAERAAHYEIPQNAARLQTAIEDAMARAAETPALRGVSIDSSGLSGSIRSDLQKTFSDVEDVLFLTLYKHDVGYN